MGLRFIRAFIFVYILIWLILGGINYKFASNNFYFVDRHFDLYFTQGKDIAYSVIERSWCAIIATHEFLKKSLEERRAFAKDFFNKEIKNLAAEQGYNIDELESWFMQYAVRDIESMPVIEYMLDWKGDKTVLYRKIDLTKKPKRSFSYFFITPDLFKDAFWAFIGVGIPLILVYFAILRYFFRI